MSQSQKAESFRKLHHGAKPVVLPNAWDAATAALVERAGFPAVATSSAGVAFSKGFPDGEVISRDGMLAAVREIVGSVSVPVTADMETGYGSAPETVAETVRLTWDAGAIGLNIEDGVGHVRVLDLELARSRIEAAREASADMVLNGRVDVYFAQEIPPENKLAEAVKRGNAYLEAGADCAFVIAVTSAEDIKTLVKEIDGPVNVIGGMGGLDINALTDIGVKRISLGGGLSRAAMGYVDRCLKEILETGSLSFLEGAIPHPKMNKLMAKG